MRIDTSPLERGFLIALAIAAAIMLLVHKPWLDTACISVREPDTLRWFEVCGPVIAAPQPARAAAETPAPAPQNSTDAE